MKRFFIVLGSFILFCVAARIVYMQTDYYAAGTWRYKITVNVQTPEGLKSGSAVREVYMDSSTFPIKVMSGLPKIVVKGEAVAVDLGKRGVLFAVMDVDGSYRHVSDAFPYPRPLSRRAVRYYDKLENGRAVLDREQYPLMVRFRDISDPKTVEPVYRVERYDARDANGFFGQKMRVLDDTELFFGAGVYIESVVIEMTNEPVTIGHVDDYLPKDFTRIIIEGWQQLSTEEQMRLLLITHFRTRALK